MTKPGSPRLRAALDQLPAVRHGVVEDLEQVVTPRAGRARSCHRQGGGATGLSGPLPAEQRRALIVVDRHAHAGELRQVVHRPAGRARSRSRAGRRPRRRGTRRSPDRCRCDTRWFRPGDRRARRSSSPLARCRRSHPRRAAGSEPMSAATDTKRRHPPGPTPGYGAAGSVASDELEPFVPVGVDPQWLRHAVEARGRARGAGRRRSTASAGSTAAAHGSPRGRRGRGWPPHRAAPPRHPPRSTTGTLPSGSQLGTVPTANATPCVPRWRPWWHRRRRGRRGADGPTATCSGRSWPAWSAP